MWFLWLFLLKVSLILATEILFQVCWVGRDFNFQLLMSFFFFTKIFLLFLFSKRQGRNVWLFDQRAIFLKLRMIDGRIFFAYNRAAKVFWHLYLACTRGKAPVGLESELSLNFLFQNPWKIISRTLVIPEALKLFQGSHYHHRKQ